jgi:hypothetical protein
VDVRQPVAANSGLSFRRIALVAAPLIAAALLVVGVFADPAIDESGRELAREYAENPGREQVSAVAFHFAFVMWAPIVFALVGLIHGRGVWLANTAAILATLGATTLPGFLLTDFYDIAIYGELGGDAWDQVNDRIEELWGAGILFISGFLGHMLCLPLVLFAAWRARLVALWAPIAAVVALVAAQAIRPFGLGLLILAAFLVVLAYLLSRIYPRPSEQAA